MSFKPPSKESSNFKEVVGLDLRRDQDLTIILGQEGSMDLAQELGLKEQALSEVLEPGGILATPVGQENMEMFKLNQEDLFQVTCSLKDQILELLDLVNDREAMAPEEPHLVLPVERIDLADLQLINHLFEITLLAVIILTRGFLPVPQD